MPFNALAMAHITKQYRTDMLTYWQKLQKNIEWAAYHGFDYYVLDLHEWQYMDKLRDYGFEITYTENCENIVRWDRISFPFQPYL